MINIPESKNNRKKITFFRKITSSLDFGYKYFNSKEFKLKIRHANKKNEIIAFLQSPALNRINRLSNKDYNNHFNDEKTIYFSGNSRRKNPQTLLMIDIDCHGVGHYQDAVNFANLLKNKIPLLKDMTYERSTNGKGVHGYIIIDKQDFRNRQLNSLFNRLELNCKTHLNGRISDVEIKGSLPIINYQDDKPFSVITGTLAKLPRTLNEFPVVKAQELNRLPIIQKEIKEKTKRKKNIGSISGKRIKRREIKCLLPLARKILNEKEIQSTGRAKVIDEDLAVMLRCLFEFTNNMNADGSLPMARFGGIDKKTKKEIGLWSALYKGGDTYRQYSPKRAAAMRNLLDSLGFIEWENNKYVIGNLRTGIKGKACKWKASKELMYIISTLITNQEKERTSLAVTQKIKVKLPIQKLQKNIIKPQKTTVYPQWMRQEPITYEYDALAA